MPPASAAPRLPASMMPGPPPVQITSSRLPVRARAGCRAGRTRAPRRRRARAAASPGPRAASALRRVGDAGAAEHHHRRDDAALGQRHLGLQELELQPHRPELVAGQEVRVAEGEAVARLTASAACRAAGPSARGPRGRRGSGAAARWSWSWLVPARRSAADCQHGPCRLIACARSPPERTGKAAPMSRAHAELERAVEAAWEARDDDHARRPAAPRARRSRRRSRRSTRARCASPSGRRTAPGR